MFSMHVTVVLVRTARTAITQLMRSRTSSDVLREHQQRKQELLRPTCHQWAATVATRRQMEMDRHQMVAVIRRRMVET
jgi:predicted ATPase